MQISPLIQLKNIISKALWFKKFRKSYLSFFLDVMTNSLSHNGRLNFTQLGLCTKSSEGRFRFNFKKPFDWLMFNLFFAQSIEGHRTAIAIDPCFIPKSGKKTPGLGPYWAGCFSAVRRGLEILGMALIDADTKESIFLKAAQTTVDKVRGRKPKCTNGMQNPDSLIGWYLRILNQNCKELLSLSKNIVADAYFSKESFVTGVLMLGFNLISRLRDDVRLRYLYTGPKLQKRGRPKKFEGRVDLKNLDLTVFQQENVTYDETTCTIYSAVVWAVSLKREVRVAIVDFDDPDKKRQGRKIFFSTDTTMSAKDIFDIYRTRFQLEFIFRDAKQFTGLTHCQARNKEALEFAFNASLSAVNVAKAFARENDLTLSVGSVKTMLHNAVMMDRFFSMFGKSPNLQKNNTIFKELLFYGVRTAS